MPKYRVTIGGEAFEVNSERELTDFEVYSAAKAQVGAPSRPVATAADVLNERYPARAISDTGEPYEDAATRLQAIAEPMLHPQSWTDLAALALPTGVPSLAGYVRDVAGVTKRAAQEAPKFMGLPNPVSMLKSGYRIITKDMPAEAVARANRIGVERYAPNVSDYAAGAATPEAAVERLTTPPVATAPVTAKLTPKALIDAATAKAGVKLLPRQTAIMFEKVKANIPADEALKQVLAEGGAKSATAMVSAESPALLRMSLTPAEQQQALDWAREGINETVIAQRIQESRQFANRFKLATPTPDQTQFPKGMRGKARHYE